MLRALVLLVTLAFAVSFAAPTPAADPCAGMDAYETALLAAGKPWADSLIATRFFDRDPLTITAAEWLNSAAHAETAHAALTAIDPPDGVADWHAAQIDTAGLQATIARTAATSGFMTAALMANESATKLDARLETTRREAIKTCPAFAGVYARWDMLDGEADATPEATPAR